MKWFTRAGPRCRDSAGVLVADVLSHEALLSYNDSKGSKGTRARRFPVRSNRRIWLVCTRYHNILRKTYLFEYEDS